MSTTKTAISIQESLFEETKILANKLHMSRSKLFARAMRDFIRKQENQQLFQQLNMAYDDRPNTEERKWQGRVKNRQRKLVEGEW